MARKFFHICCGMLMLALCAPVGSYAGVIDFASDPSWSAAVMNVDESVGATVGVAECYPISVPFDPGQIPGACVVWLPGWTLATPADDQGAFFSKEIFIPGAPVSGTIYVAVDDWVQVSVNGTVVCDRGSVTDILVAAAAQGPPLPFDVGPALRAGSNSIQVWARNGPATFTVGCSSCTWAQNPCWVYFGGSVLYDNPVPTARRSWGTLKAFYR